MGPKKPKEDPEAKAERLRSRKRAETERRDVSQRNAEGLTKEIQSVFSRPSLFAVLSGNRLAGTGNPRPASTSASPTARPTLGRR